VPLRWRDMWVFSSFDVVLLAVAAVLLALVWIAGRVASRAPRAS
jgi:hypothetical protein